MLANRFQPVLCALLCAVLLTSGCDTHAPRPETTPSGEENPSLAAEGASKTSGMTTVYIGQPGMRVSMSDFSRLQRDLAKDASVVAWLQNIQDVVYDELISKPIPRELALEVGDILKASDEFAKPVQISQKKVDRINDLTGASELMRSTYVTSKAKQIVRRYPKIKDLNSVQLSRLLDEVYKKVDTHIENVPKATPSHPDPDGPTRFGHQPGLPSSLPALETNVTYRCDVDLLNKYNTCRVRARRQSNAHGVIGTGGAFLLVFANLALWVREPCSV